MSLHAPTSSLTHFTGLLLDSRDRFYCQSAGPDCWISRRTCRLCNEKVQWICWFLGYPLSKSVISVWTCELQALHVFVSCRWESVKSSPVTGSDSNCKGVFFFVSFFSFLFSFLFFFFFSFFFSFLSFFSNCCYCRVRIELISLQIKET